MNLGDSHLKTVNTSRPQLIHSNSKQSVTASDDYYSLNSNESSNDDRTTVPRYETPPQRMRTNEPNREALQSEATIPTIRPVRTKERSDNPQGVVVQFSEPQPLKRKPVSAESPIYRRSTASDTTSPMTPVDDTPYIHFAIEQLTRDEELLGARRHGAPSEDSYPAERSGRKEVTTNDRSSSSSERPLQERSRPTASQGESKRQRLAERWNGSNRFTAQDIYLPADITAPTFRYPNLNYVPTPLRLPSLATLILCCLLMIAAIIFVNVFSKSHHGLWEYDGVGTARYFVFQFLPQLLAILIILWLLIIQSATYRIFPFTAMASGRSINGSQILHTAALFPTNHLIPNLSFFRQGELLLGMGHLFIWLSYFTVPLQCCLFQTRYYLLKGDNLWRWTAVRPIGWTLLVLYVLLTVGLVLIFVRFHRGPTGLKWDPVSLADILTFLHRSNFLGDFEQSEAGQSRGNEYGQKNYRLGYWTTSRRPTEMFYGLGEENAPVRRYSLEQGRTKAETDTSMDLESQRPMKSATYESFQANIHSSRTRYRWTPWFLRDTFVVAWIVIAIVLMIAFIVVSFVNQAVELGFLPLLPAPATTQGFSPADFLYSFLPAFFGMILFLVWQPIDMYFRALQPFANLAKARGTFAEKSLLLDYPSCIPVEITFQAILSGHYKVAWISFISLLSITLPVLAGGIFTAQFFTSTQDVRIAACMPAYEALVAFLVVYCLSFLVIWPTRKRYLPHDIRTLGHLISFVYQSPILRDDAFREPRSRIDLVTRLLGTPSGEKSTPRYAFGVYVGRDGKEHLGIDRLQRPGSGEMLITTGVMK